MGDLASNGVHYEGVNERQRERISSGRGFVAALDQSGGSTPDALATYGIGHDRYDSDEQMFELVQQMRARVMTDPAFDGGSIIGTILFEQTMRRRMNGLLTGDFLWNHKGIVPFLKVDQGREPSSDGVTLMKPLDRLEQSLDAANEHGMFGTKMRSFITAANDKGIHAVVDQQFDVAARIAAAGLVPIIEPEVSIKAPDKAAAERVLHDALADHIADLPRTAVYMLKLSLPTEHGLYSDLADDPRILKVLALSGGYSKDEACELLAHEPSMIASFSRGLLEGLREDQPDDEFSATLARSVEQIARASDVKL